MHTFMRLKLLPYMTQYHMVVCKSDKNECILHTANPIRVTNMSIEQSTTHHEHHQCRKYQTSYHILLNVWIISNVISKDNFQIYSVI